MEASEKYVYTPHRVLNSNDGWKGLGTGEAMQKLFDKDP